MMSVSSSGSTTPRLPKIHPEFSSPGSDYMTYIYNVHAANEITSPSVSNRSRKSDGRIPRNSNDKENMVGAQFPDIYPAGYDMRSQRSKNSTSELSSVTQQTGDGGELKEMDTDLQLNIGTTFQRFNSPTWPDSSNQNLAVQTLVPPRTSAKSSIRSAKTVDTATGSLLKLSFVESPKLEMYEDAESNRKSSWNPPLLSTDEYERIKTGLLQKGKFKNHLMKYFRLEKKPWEREDDGNEKMYDVKLDTQLGFELLADETAREVLEDGVHHEYMKTCRQTRRNPNTYFLRHSLDEELRMRYRYLSKGDARSICCQLKGDMTMAKIDLSDNGIQHKGMKHLSSILVENKHLTELILARNKLEAVGVKHLKDCLISNCFLLTLDISENAFGEKGCKYIAAILEENTTLKHLNISRNDINDKGITQISKALANNVSLKELDIGWNNITSAGAVKLADSLKKNSELELLYAKMNGFGEVGGKALVNVLRQNNVVKEVDLSANRITDSVVKLLSISLDQLEGLSVLILADNPISTKSVMDLMSRLMNTTAPICHIDFTSVHVTDELKGLANALHIVHDITIAFNDPPARREFANDLLTRHLVELCEFMEEEEIEVEDLYPDYEDWDDGDRIMVTVKDALQALQCTGKVVQQDKFQRIKSRFRRGRNRKFLVKELATIYDNTICGKDSLREKPLRSHLRHSIREERVEKERREKAKQNKRYGAPTAKSKD